MATEGELEFALEQAQVIANQRRRPMAVCTNDAEVRILTLVEAQELWDETNGERVDVYAVATPRLEG